VKGVKKMSPKMGQKLTDNPKGNRIQFRMDDETVKKLDCIVSEQNSDRSKVIRKGIEIQYEQLENKKE
jgi:predicted transcriptional regulator